MNRKSFLKKSVLGGLAMGYSGKITDESFANPKNANSRPSDLKITDIRGATLAAIYDFPIIKIYTNQVSLDNSIIPAWGIQNEPFACIEGMDNGGCSIHTNHTPSGNSDSSAMIN